MSFSLRLLGPPELTDDRGDVPSGLGPGKPLAILAYLAVEGAARRDAVASLLWEDADEDRARNAFRQALHRLRGALGDVVEADRERIALVEGEGLETDVARFEAALAEGDHATAVTLWRGDFLDGFELGESAFDHWVDGQRARFAARYHDALAAAARTALDDGDHATAVKHASKLVRRAPLDASAAMLEARALAAAGRAKEAASALRAFSDRYRDELDEPPPDDVTAMLERLAGKGDAQAVEEAGPDAAPAEPFLREAELARLLAAWRRAVDGEGRTVLLEGETGAGKRRLADELVARIQALDPAVVLRGSERLNGRGVPYESVAQALRGILGARGLAGASSHLLAEAARLLPDLRDRFDLPAPAAVEDDAGRLRFFEGVAAVLDAVAYERPVCVVLERFQHADDATRDLVFFLANRLRGSGVLFLVSYRPDGDAEGVDAGGEGALEVIRLEPLPEAALLEIIAASREGSGLDRAVQERAARLAEGNPLRALTLARSLAAGEEVGGAPARLVDILDARLQATAPDERRLLVALALVGRPVPLRELSACTHLSEAATLDAYGRLREQGLVRGVVDGAMIAHEPAAEAVLELAGPAGASLIAGWAAEALAEAGAPDGEVARLYARSGRSEEASDRAMAAARSAAAAGAWQAAVEMLELAADVAADPARKAAAEAQLAGLGGGRVRLGAGEAPVPEAARAETGATARPGDRAGPPAGGAARAGSGAPAAAPGWWRRPVVVGVVLAVLAMAAFAALPVLRAPGPVATRGRVLHDTLVLVRTEPDGREVLLGVTGEVGEGATITPVPLEPVPVPAWLESAGTGRALVSPDGRWIARKGRDGDDLVIASRSDGEPVRLVPGGAALDWAPDGSALLVSTARRLADGRRDTDLWIVPVADGAPVPVDTAADRYMVSARWAPNGVRVAWGARVGHGGQQDVFVAYADGTGRRNASDHPGEDRDPAWSPDGRRVAFTTDRTGTTDIYAVEVEGGRLWRLTWDDAADDRASFSPLGDFLAFESTRDGEAGVYVMASFGGEARRVSPAGQGVGHRGWRGRPVPYLAFLRLGLPALEPGGRARLEIEPVYTDYVPRNRGSVRWLALDDRVRAPPSAQPEETAGAVRVPVAGVRRGLGRIAVDAGGWRGDTAIVKVGDGGIPALQEDFEGRLEARWNVGGRGVTPAPGLGRGGSTAIALPAADSAASLTSITSFPLAYGFVIRLHASGGPGSNGVLRIQLVGARGKAGSGGVLASLTVDGTAGRVRYAVDRQQADESADFFGDPPGGWHELALLTDADGRVAFRIDGVVRHRSQLGVPGPSGAANRARLRIVAEGPGERVLVDDVTVIVGGNKSLP